MKDLDSGFSFGVDPDGLASNEETADIDAIEVSGEPVSRAEARKMGITAFDTSYRAKAATTIIRVDQLPKDITDTDSEKLKQALSHLQHNEIEDALTLAQEVVWEYPDLIPAKLIIARCFINRKEYNKSLAILNAIPEHDRDFDVTYYMALTQSRLGDVREAISNLKRVRTSTADTLVRKRASDLLLHLQGEKTVCPACGKQTLYDSMVDIGDQTVCTNCAKIVAEGGVAEEIVDEDEFDDDEEPVKGETKRRKRLRPPLTKGDILIRVVFGLFVLAFLVFGVYMLQFISPDHYRTVRPYLPAGWTFLSPIATDTPVSAGPSGPEPPRVVPTMLFDSPTLTRAVVDVPLRHQLVIEGMEDRPDAEYRAVITPPPAGPHSLDAARGEFVWTPAAADAGKTFVITFTGVFTTVQSMDQVNRVTVSPGPVFKGIATLPPRRPGETTHLVAHDLSGNGSAEFIAVTGRFWDGVISLYQDGGDGFYKLVTSTTFPGRPAGAGGIRAGGEYGIAVADYWNSRLRLYAFRSGHIAEMALSFDLPGRPVLAGFDAETSLAAVLCRTENVMRAVSFRQEGQLNTERLGDWTLPNEPIWQKVVIPSASEALPEPLPVVVGGTAGNGVYLLDPANDDPVRVQLDRSGAIIDAAAGPDGKVYILLRDGESLSVTSFFPTPDGRAVDVRDQPFGSWPALSGLAALQFSASAPGPDIVVLDAATLRAGLALVAGAPPTPLETPLPTAARVLGNVATMTKKDGSGAMLLYLDAARDVYTVDLPTAEGK
ncbi:MAG: tetratricopeptide repeat protein [Planctomycetaceae bacterium]|nr:tetratricopeptide repeat protein [Planctomycetaceae bacterium]